MSLDHTRADDSGDEDLQWQLKTDPPDLREEPEVSPTEILADIRNRHIDFSDPDSDEVQEFHRKYNEPLSKQKGSKTVAGKGNILHILANESSESGEYRDYWSETKLSQFLKWLLGQHWTFLEAKTKTEQYYPLHTALSKRNEIFIRAILGLKDLKNIRSVLSDQINGDRNYLEIAILSNSPMIVPIARRCAELSAQIWTPSEPNATGKKSETPLHVAVAKICHTRGKSDLERALRCDVDDKANPSPAAKSVYDKWKRRHTIKPESKSSYVPTDTATEKPGDTATNTATPIEKDGYERHGSNTIGTVSQRDIIDLILEIIQDYQRSQQPASQVEILKLFIELSSSFDALECRVRVSQDPKVLGRTPYQDQINRIEEAWKIIMKTVENDGIAIRESPAERMTDGDALRMVVIKDPMADAIRYHCIRYYNRDRIARCLYKPGDERHIDFDLAGLRSPSISRAFLNQLSKHLRFKSILKYVALPKLGFNDYSSESQNQHDDPRRSFRKELPDLRQVFQWLRDNKVRRILKVTIIDYRAPCHSNAAIEEALAGFNVEIWDWKKIDICTDVIASSTKLARQISLYSSGNNAVLLGWASSDGLGDRRKFPKLENVRVFIAKGQEGDRRAEYIKAFEEKIRRIEISDGRTGRKHNRDGSKGESGEMVGDSSREMVTVKHRLDDGRVSYAADFKNDEIPEQQ